MLRGMIILMSIQWAGACLCYALARIGGAWSIIIAGVLGFFGLGLALVSPIGLFQYLALFAIAMVSLYWQRPSVARFGLLGIVASLPLVPAVDYYAQTVWGNVAREFPLESLSNRLAYETVHEPSASSGPSGANTIPVRLAALPSTEALQKLDQSYYPGRYASYRSRSLKMAHATQVERFSNVADSFGVSRMPAPTPRGAVRINRRPIRFPEATLVSTGDQLAALASPRTAPAAIWLEPYHTSALMSFANFEGWGYVRDRDHVAGFESHRFIDVPVGPDKQWQTLRVELVSLLKHDEPGVYVSEYLPAMDELREATVRPLDAFEEQSLAALMKGGEIEAAVVGPYVRMLGAIRAADKCLQCHTVEHGAPLGAFSYVLVPAEFAQR